MLRTIRRPSRVIPPFNRLQAARRRHLATQDSKLPAKQEETSSTPSSQEVRQVSPLEQAGVDTQPTPSGSSSQVPVDINQLKERILKWREMNASSLRGRMDKFSSAAQVTFQQLGGRLNEVTGYHEIEMLKKLVAENERKMLEIREAAKAAKTAYEEAVARRSNSQRETNDLLQRKSSWTDADVMRFTQLVRADHVHEQDEARAQVRAAEADAASERQFAELMRAILARYHEEQVWSDKIRSASTYGSLAALGLNLFVFILAIALVEPWKRDRLVKSFEKRVIELNEAKQRIVEEGLQELRMHQEAQENVLVEIRAAQASLKENVEPAIILRGEDNEAGIEVVSSVPTMELERSVRTARDREIWALAATGALVTGVAGFILGSWFG